MVLGDHRTRGIIRIDDVLCSAGGEPTYISYLWFFEIIGRGILRLDEQVVVGFMSAGGEPTLVIYDCMIRDVVL